VLALSRFQALTVAIEMISALGVGEAGRLPPGSKREHPLVGLARLLDLLQELSCVVTAMTRPAEGM
jgi:hypothetical protein